MARHVVAHRARPPLVNIHPFWYYLGFAIMYVVRKIRGVY